MKSFYTDARPSGAFYRGELWYGTPDDRYLVYITDRQYVTVEDAAFAARKYIWTATGQRIKAHQCVYCAGPVTALVPRDRELYAQPCGHRQFSGRVEKVSAA